MTHTPIAPMLTLAQSGWALDTWRFEHPHWLLGLWGLPVLAGLLLLTLARARRAHRRVADESMISSLLGPSRRWNTIASALLTTAAGAALIVAVARPQSDPREIEVEAKGRDVVFLVDVSRSMLARDVAPNRLEKAKLWINDLVDDLGGDRVGLVAFAGSSAVLSPLTNDHLFFKLALEELSPSSVLVGGTNIGDALRRTMDLVYTQDSDDVAANYRDIVLITDGEDQESLPVEAARQAATRGIRIISIGIGSDAGATVPWDEDSTTPRDRVVVSKLESGTLRAIAGAAPSNVYLEVGTGTTDLAQVYRDLIASAQQRTLETSSQTVYTERFMIFIALGLALIFIEQTIIPKGARRAPA